VISTLLILTSIGYASAGGMRNAPRDPRVARSSAEVSDRVFRAAHEAAAGPGHAVAIYEQPDSGACVLVVSGIGTHFTGDSLQDRIDNFWYTINRDVADSLLHKLTSAGYAAQSMVIPRKQDEKVLELVAGALARARCERLLEIRHRISTDNAGKFWGFVVEVKGLTPDSGGGSYRVGDATFQRLYRFAFTDEEFGRLSIGGFAARLLGDVIASGALVHP